MHHEYIISSVRVFNSIPKLQLMFFLLIAINMQISSSINSLTILAENNSKKSNHHSRLYPQIPVSVWMCVWMGESVVCLSSQ